jgi:hypothetical protein
MTHRAGLRWRLPALVAGLAVAAAVGLPPTASHAANPAQAPASITPMSDISSGCPGQNAEVEEANTAPRYVYAIWIGCGGIGFARSTDGGLHFRPPITVPGSAGQSWDPAIAVARSGTVYLSYMHASGSGSSHQMYPVVTASFDHGATFPQVSAVRPPVARNWGDRDFIAVGKTAKTVYLTWDYGPSAAEVKQLCSPTGSCAYSNGDFNAVIQKSTDGGKTWGPIRPVGPGFPLGGGYSAPLVVCPSGRVDVLYIGHPTSRRTLAVHPGYEFFTSSANGTAWPAHPLKLWPSKGTLSVPEWWIDGDIAADSAGNLYATWDTQTRHADIGWLTYSTDRGRHWSRPVRVTPGTGNAPHIVEAAGGAAGVAYIGWQTSAPRQGYATYLRPFSIRKGWLGPTLRVSRRYGRAGIWPGDTFGITVLPGPGTHLALTWGSAVGSSPNSEIYASNVTLPK